MEVKINKEIRNYTEAVFLGLTIRQCVCCALAILAAVILGMLFHPVLGTELTSWICIASAVPFALMGFVSYNGMKLETFVRTVIRSEFLTPKVLLYRAENLYEKALGKGGENTETKENGASAESHSQNTSAGDSNSDLL